MDEAAQRERRRGGDENIKAEESSPVGLAIGSCNDRAIANNYRHCGGQGDKILMHGRMRISNIVKNNFIVAYAISFDPSPESLPIPITLPQSCRGVFYNDHGHHDDHHNDNDNKNL